MCHSKLTEKLFCCDFGNRNMQLTLRVTYKYAFKELVREKYATVPTF